MHLQERGFAADSLDGCLQPDLDTNRARSPLHRLRDGPHTTHGVPPCALDSVDLAERMVKQEVTGAGIIRSREAADDRVESQPPL